METIVQSLPLTKIPNSHTCSASHSPLFSHFNASSVAFSSVNCHSPKCFLTHLPSVRPKAKEKDLGAVVHASEAESPSSDYAERWLLEPVGDGNTRHLGLKVERPGAYEIVSSEVTVGRVPEKADLVIPVATVSGLHARIQKNEGNLLVTDLDSTNGTFIDDQRLRPGKAATVPPGSRITFGDIHLAMFRVSKVESVEAAGKTEKIEAEVAEVDSLNKPENIETT